MAIRILEKVDLKAIREELLKEGWSEGRFNGKPALVKEQEDCIWIGVLEEEPFFLSLPKEESSKVHSEGVKALKSYLEELGLRLNFSLPIKVGGYGYA